MKSLLLVLFSALVANSALAGQFCIGEYKSNGPESLFGIISYDIQCEDGLYDHVASSFSYSKKAAKEFRQKKLAPMLNKYSLSHVVNVSGALSNRGDLQVFAVRESGRVPDKSNVLTLFRFVSSNMENLSIINGAGVQTTYPKIELNSSDDMSRVNQIMKEHGLKASEIFYLNRDNHQVIILSK